MSRNKKLINYKAFYKHNPLRVHMSKKAICKLQHKLDEMDTAVSQLAFIIVGLFSIILIISA